MLNVLEMLYISLKNALNLLAKGFKIKTEKKDSVDIGVSIDSMLIHFNALMHTYIMYNIHIKLCTVYSLT